MTDRPLDVINQADAAKKLSDLKIVGDTDRWILKFKASSESAGFAHSTKVLQLPSGCLVQTSSIQNGEVSQALAFVPGANHKDFGNGAG